MPKISDDLMLKTTALIVGGGSTSGFVGLLVWVAITQSPWAWLPALLLLAFDVMFVLWIFQPNDTPST